MRRHRRRPRSPARRRRRRGTAGGAVDGHGQCDPGRSDHDRGPPRPRRPRAPAGTLARRRADLPRCRGVRVAAAWESVERDDRHADPHPARPGRRTDRASGAPRADRSGAAGTHPVAAGRGAGGRAAVPAPLHPGGDDARLLRPGGELAHQPAAARRVADPRPARPAEHRSRRSRRWASPVPPVLTYIGKGSGASIIRGPGSGCGRPGTVNPVAAIKIVRHNLYRPTSLFHETGHQVAHLTGWNDDARDGARPRRSRDDPALRGDVAAVGQRDRGRRLRVRPDTGYASVAALYDVVGDAATILRWPLGDPHPVGWLRTLLGCAMCRHVLRAGPVGRARAGGRRGQPADPAPSRATAPLLRRSHGRMAELADGVPRHTGARASAAGRSSALVDPQRRVARGAGRARARRRRGAVDVAALAARPRASASSRSRACARPSSPTAPPSGSSAPRPGSPTPRAPREPREESRGRREADRQAAWTSAIGGVEQQLGELADRSAT